jgi:hypothetical protein
MTAIRRPGLSGLILTALLLAGAVTALIAVAVVRGEDSAAPDPGPDIGTMPPVASQRAAGHAFWGTDHRGGPLRWDACAPVEFVLNQDVAPDHAEDDLRAALAMLADASGLDLVLSGTTAERPDLGRPLVEPSGEGWRWRPVLVAWASPGTTDIPMDDLDRGVALPVAVRDGQREAFVTGQVLINASRTDLVAGFGDRSVSVGATLVHEIGHILGLDHVDDLRQMMSAEPGRGPVTFGPGDLAGLRAIGAAAGCNPAPPPSAGRGLRVTR